MKSKYKLAAALVALLPVCANAMSVADFLGKADALQAKGMGALFSPDFKLLMGEMKDAAKAYREDAATARAGGRSDLGCPPVAGKLGVSSTQVMAEFKSLPAAERARTSAKAAFYAMMRKKFPCQ